MTNKLERYKLFILPLFIVASLSERGTKGKYRNLFLGLRANARKVFTSADLRTGFFMEAQDIRQLAADILNKKKTISEIPRGYIYFIIQKTFLNMGNLPLVKEMATLSGQRLAAKGYQKCGQFGWVLAKDIPNMGIGLKYGNWLVMDKDKFMRYKL